MVAHKRGGRQGVGGRRKQRTQPRRRSQSTSDENSSDSGETTRCVCGEMHNLGLMVQCDKCEVWQHCECMGLEQPDIPDHYYCEQCKPENHKLNRTSNGRTKRQYVSFEKAPKKRMTLNSREASMSLEDVLAARNALELYEHGQKEDQGSTSPPTLSESPNTDTKKEDQEVIKKEERPNNKRKKEVELKLPDTIDEKSEPPSSTVSSIGHEETPYICKEIVEETLETPKPSPSKPKRRQPKHQAEERKRPNTKPARQSTGNRRGKPRSRTSTPVRESSPIVQSSEQDEETLEDNISTLLFEYFSPQARASSPPAKTRLPHARMTLSEMNRRANQILEYISSIQVEMAIKETSANDTTNVNLTKSALYEGEQEEDDDNDSLSSASTIPLNHDEEEGPVDNHKQSSMEIMDILTRKLIKFQRRFGSRNRALYEEAMMEGEGRITRSREASGNANTYRNMMAH